MDKLIGRCVKELLEEYLIEPAMYLRELNLQAQLAKKIEVAIGRRNLTTMASVVPHVESMRARDWRLANAAPQMCHRVSRVQQGLKIVNVIPDIIVLRKRDAHDPIELRLAGMGAVDLIAPVRLCDVDSVIEIKAACSADANSCNAFKFDVRKLFRLLPHDPEGSCPSLHFVLIDKSLPVGRFNKVEKRAQVDEWHSDQRKLRKGRSRVSNFTMSNSPLPTVSIWDLTPNRSNLRCRRRWLDAPGGPDWD